MPKASAGGFSRLFSLLLALSLAIPLLAVPRQLAVVELLTSASCTGCPGAAAGVEDLLANGHAVAVITHHRSDPFENLSSLARLDFYGQNSTPTAYFDGLDPCTSASSASSLYSEYLPRVNSRLAIPAAFTLAATGSSDSLSYVLDITITKAEADTNSSVVLFAAVTESALRYNWLNHTTVENVNRMLAPTVYGTPIDTDSLEPGTSLPVELTFVIKPNWVLANLELVLWLQNTVTMEILQGVKYPLAAFPDSPLMQPVPAITYWDGEVILTWPAVPGASYYEIQVCDTPGGDFTPYDQTEQTTWSDRVFASTPTRFFRIVAIAF